MKEQLKAQMKEAMKAKNKIELTTVRAILSAIQYEEMSKSKESLSESETIAILKNELKKRKESLEFAEKDSRTEEIENIKTEINVINGMLPKQLSEDELKNTIQKFKADNPDCNMGNIMKHLKDNFDGQYDGKSASSLAKQIAG